MNITSYDHTNMISKFRTRNAETKKENYNDEYMKDLVAENNTYVEQMNINIENLCNMNGAESQLAHAIKKILLNGIWRT